LLLHLVAIVLASAVAIATDRDSDRLRALFLSFGITGWITALSAVVFLVFSAIKRRLRTRDVIMLVILLLIGLDESRMATDGWELLRALTSGKG
jgi:hypothetical protein